MGSTDENLYIKTFYDEICKNGEKILWYFNKSSKGFDLSSNPLTMLRKCDFICLSNNKIILEVWEWSKMIFGHTDEQVYFYEDFCDAEGERKIIKDILNHFKNSYLVIFPNKKNLILNEEALNYNYKIFSDNIYSLPDKRWLHNVIPRSKFSSNYFDYNLPNDIKVPRGFSCYSEEELREAKQILKEQLAKSQKLIIKDVSSSGGDNIYKFESDEEFEIIIKEINFEDLSDSQIRKAYLIEEMIQICENKNCDTYVVHYLGGYRCPGIYKQNASLFGYSGMNCIQPEKEIQEKIILQSESISNAIKFSGPWGMDFVIDINGIPNLIDINHGRICGSHYIRFFVNLFARNCKFFDCGNFGCDYYYDIKTIQQELNENNIQFDFTTQKGIMLTRLGEKWNGCVYLFSDSKEHLDILRFQFAAILKLKGTPTEFNIRVCEWDFLRDSLDK